MLTATAQYRAALPYPHGFAARMRVYHDGVLMADMPDSEWLISGSVAASLGSGATRALDVIVKPELYPALYTDLLAPESALVQIDAGIRYPDGSSELFTVFTGRVEDAVREPDGSARITGEDIAAEVIRYPFEQPEASDLGAPLTQEFERIVRQAVPSATFGAYDTTSVGPTPLLAWDDDRGQALDDIAGALGGRWYALGDGDFVVRRYPYTVETPVLAMADGPGGTISGARINRTRDGVANIVIVVAERLDGGAPVRVVARDTRAGSPTNVAGAFGRAGEIIRIQTPLTAAEAGDIARSRLAAVTAMSEQWSVEAAADWTLEPGDTVSLTYRGVTAVQVIDSIRYPLGTGPMSITSRAAVPPPLTED